MRRIPRDVAELKIRAIDSLVLGIELFNRPHGRGRPEAVLILLHHAFEMLLKAIIKNRTGTIHRKEGTHTYGFDKCLDIVQQQIGLLSTDERATLSILDAHRDVAVHYYQELSEDLLYMQAQAATTLFDSLLARGFDDHLADQVPERVLPVSTRPPIDLQLLVGRELKQIDQLLVKGRRQGAIAAARLRPLIALAKARRLDGGRASERDVGRAVKRRRQGDDWTLILPEVAQLRLDTTGNGISVNLRIRKDADMAVRVAKPGDPVVGTVIKQEINIWDRYNMGRDDLAKKIGLSGPRTSALIFELDIQNDDECFKTLRRKKSEFKGYSKKALDRIRGALDSGLDVDEVWRKQRHRLGGKRTPEQPGGA